MGGFFPSFAGGRGLPIDKKLQKWRDFCFQNERIATTGRMSQPAALKQEACRSRQCRGEGDAAAGSAATRGGASAGFISVAGRAAAGRCCGGRVSAVGHILRRTREASLASAVQNEGRHCCAAERSRPECQPAALRSRRRESGAKGPL